MKILIVGAGRVGYAIAASLVSEENDITVIDQNTRHIQYLQSHYDLRGIRGDALDPELLQSAGAEDTDMLIAVTSSDETNLSICLLAAQIFNIPTRIARVRKHQLRAYPRILGEEGFQATSIIWPEEAITDYLCKLITYPQASQVQEFGDGRAYLLAVRAKTGSPIIGRAISDLDTHLPHIGSRIVAIFRRNRAIECKPSTIIESNDEIFCLCAAQNTSTVLNEFRHNEPTIKNLILAGSAKLAVALTNQLLENNPTGVSYNIRIIEENPQKAEELARISSGDTIVVQGHYTDEDTLVGADIETCDLFLALSDSDEHNILSSLLAKRLGAKRAIAMVDRESYGNLMQGSQIDITLSTAQAALGELIKHVRHCDVVAAYSLRRGLSEALEIIAHGDRRSSKIVGRMIKNISLPEGCTIAAVIRGDDDNSVVLMGRPDLEIEAEDHVIVFVSNKRLIPKIERLFAVNVGFF